MDSVKDLLSDPLKGKKSAEGILCYLFREVLLWRNVNWFVWNRRLTAYFEKPHNRENPDKGNLNKALKANDMNWSGFRKAIDFLSPAVATLDIHLVWEGDKRHSFKIYIDPSKDELDPTVNDFRYDGCEIFDGAKPAKSLMTQLFRHIMHEVSKDVPDQKLWWEQLFDDYVKNPVNVVGLPQKEINSNVNALRRSLLDPKISWNGLRRGLHLLYPKAEEYTLTLQWSTDPEVRANLPDSVHPIKIANPYFIGS